MRCLSCNCLLSNRESTRKSVTTGEYLDLCDECLKEVEEILYDENEELDDEEEVEEDE